MYGLRKELRQMKRLKYRLKKLDRFYRSIVIALGIMSPVFLVLFLAAAHCFWFCWFVGFILSLLDAVLILYADEIFRWNMSWRVRHPERVTPSQNELDRREIAAVFGLLTALAFFLIGVLVKLS